MTLPSARPHISASTPASAVARPSWRASSISILLIAWAILQLGGLFTPGLLDDVDSVYIQIAREMLQRHDFVTPTIDGIRFFDKPPLMYWMAAGSMRVFGIHDWAARLPLALGVLALLFSVYALGNRLFAAWGTPGLDSETWVSTVHPDRPGLYAALATATSLGPYLYTRFYIPDILVALWMTLSVHLFLVALDRVEARIEQARSAAQAPANSTHQPVILSSANSTHQSVILSEVSRGLIARDAAEGPATPPTPGTPARTFQSRNVSPSSALLPSLGFAAVLALSVLTKGLIGIVFPLAFVLLYLLFTRRLHWLAKLHIPAATALFFLLAAPWHILVALRNPAIPMPAGVGLPASAGWAWFYLYNEHIARFLGRRIPHDYGQTPIWLFWLYALLWIMPWGAFLPAAIAFIRRQRQAALALTLWALIVLVFFTLSSRQEYYSLPALPALALMIGGLLAHAESTGGKAGPKTDPSAATNVLACHRWILLPLASLIAVLCLYFAIAAPQPRPGVTLNDVLSTNPALYNLSLGHVFDLTGQAMGFFRGPLIAVALGMIILGPVAYLVRRRAGPAHSFAANLTLAAGMIVVLLAAHRGLVRFYPILGSKGLALAVDAQLQPADLIAIDGELTAGSTLLFYTPQRDHPILLVNGRKNGPWFGSFWPDAPRIFLDDAALQRLWAGPHRVFLLTYHPAARAAALSRFGPALDFAHAGGKTILTNRTNRR